MQKYKIKIDKRCFVETPKDKKYFKGCQNTLLLSNKHALFPTRKKAKELGFKNVIVRSDISCEVNKIVGDIISYLKKTTDKLILILWGETTLEIKGKGKGGRNQYFALKFLQKTKGKYLLASLNTDSFDNTPFAGALVDNILYEKVLKNKENINRYIQNANSYEFF